MTASTAAYMTLHWRVGSTRAPRTFRSASLCVHPFFHFHLALGPAFRSSTCLSFRAIRFDSFGSTRRGVTFAARGTPHGTARAGSATRRVTARARTATARARTATARGPGRSDPRSAVAVAYINMFDYALFGSVGFARRHTVRYGAGFRLCVTPQTSHGPRGVRADAAFRGPPLHGITAVSYSEIGSYLLHELHRPQPGLSYTPVH